jgi:creatinine amidohydrolase
VTPAGETAPGARIAELTWPEVERRLAGGALALLPVGAACKEHGPHLPMNTDWIQAEWLTGELIRRHNVLAWPTVAYGFYPAFREYPGSCSLSRETFAAGVREILDDLFRFGARAAIVLNTGISTIPPLEEAVKTSRHPDRVLLVNVYSGPKFTAAVKALEQQKAGGHADEIETSIMLALAPERVDMSKAVACELNKVPGPFNRTDPQGPNYTPSGVNGNPTLASREKGEQLIRAILRDVTETLAGLERAR